MADIIKYYYTVYKPSRLRDKLALERGGNGTVPAMPMRGRPRRPRARAHEDTDTDGPLGARPNGAHAAARAAECDTIELSDEYADHLMLTSCRYFSLKK